jgi:CelD/BcsL family acetyltransferase involved in cellulose biosynthesis
MNSPVITAPAPLLTTVTCVETEREFLELEKDWNRLLMESGRPVPFLTWEWVSTWWQHFGTNSRLFVLVARDENGRVLGIAPLHVPTRRVFGALPLRSVEFLGYRGSAVCADHLDFIAGQEDREVIVSRLLEKVFERKDEWDSLVLADLAVDSPVPEKLEQIELGYGSRLRGGPQQKCPYVILPNRWDILLNSLKAKYRNNVKRRREKLAREFQVKFNSDSSVHQVAEHFEKLHRLHGLARKRKGEAGNFHLRKYREFHHAVAERMAQAGYLYLARLDCDNVTVAALYGFFLGKRLFGYQTGFDSAWARHGVGAVLQSLVFEDGIERLGATEYDFLRGDEEYKYMWTSEERGTRTVLAWGDSLSARIAKAEFAGRCQLSPVRREFREWTRMIKGKLKTFRDPGNRESQQ